MKKNDLNIEFSHIYADQDFGEEQMAGIDSLKKYLHSANIASKSLSTSILIDDYNAVELRLDEDEFIEWVKAAGAPIDFIGHESKFRSVADKIIRMLPPDKIKSIYFSSSDKEVLMLNVDGTNTGLKERRSFFRRRHTCAILSCAWTLCRLGCFKFPRGSVKNLSGKPLVADEILTILPKKYKSSEDKAMQIISLTKFSPLLKKIHHHYF